MSACEAGIGKLLPIGCWHPTKGPTRSSHLFMLLEDTKKDM